MQNVRSRRDSLIRSFSRRLDAATPILNLLLMLGAIAAAATLTYTTIIPDAALSEELDRKLEEKTQQVEQERVQVKALIDENRAMDDPWYVYDFAVERYRFVPRDGSKQG